MTTGTSERVVIDHVGHRGDGVARGAGAPLFVPCTLPGETVEIERSGERAVLRGVVAPSVERVAPVCPHFGVCGGCALQHWRTAGYRAWKRGLVTGALAQAGVAAEVDELIDAHGEGRRRAILHARRGSGRELTVGFAGRRSHAIVPIGHCPVLAPPLARVFAIGRRVAALLAAMNKPLDLHFTATDGGLDLDVRGSGRLDTAMIAALAGIAAEEKLARLTRHGEVVTQLAEPALMVGRARVILPGGSFLQATAAGEAVLAGRVGEAVGEAKKVADLFSGIGTFALRLAANMKVLAADADKEAITALARAAKTPGLKPVEALARDLFRRPLVAAELNGCDAVVLDPPRQGAEAQVRELARMGSSRTVRARPPRIVYARSPRIVYVSCNPASFARDARILCAAGYRLVRVTPVDQFRYSAHVELVGIFDA